jgi:hypothetical protein
VQLAQIKDLVVCPNDVRLILTHQYPINASFLVLQDFQEAGAARNPLPLLITESIKNHFVREAIVFCNFVTLAKFAVIIARS